MSVIAKRNGPEGRGDEKRTREKEKARRKKLAHNKYSNSSLHVFKINFVVTSDRDIFSPTPQFKPEKITLQRIINYIQFRKCMQHGISHYDIKYTE
jgi:hypothetical protein